MEKLVGDIMDEKGYTFTPLTVLLFIPIMIVAISYGNIVSEANMLANLAVGGDVTVTIANSIFTNIEKGANDGGRNAAYLATRKVIDNASVNASYSPFFPNGTSRNYVLNLTVNAINTQVVNSSQQLERETGRDIYVNNIRITNYTSNTTKLFNNSSVYITQTDPFGFYVNIKGGIPIKIVQNGQTYQTYTPTTSTYVSIKQLEDPYIWVNTKFRQSNIIQSYSYYTNYLGVSNYHMQDVVTTSPYRLCHLWDALNGTDNPSNIVPRPDYFPDTRGLSFFDRLENRTTSADNNTTRMSTFVLGDVLAEDHNSSQISILDWEYFQQISGLPITINGTKMTDPKGSYIYLSSATKTKLNITY